MTEYRVPIVDPTTKRVPAAKAPQHGDLDGLAGHAPVATGQPSKRIPETDGSGGWTLVPTPEPSAFTSDGAILGMAVVNPATVTDRTANNADFDAPTLAVSFVAPPSGKVIVTLDGTTLAASGDIYWFLRRSGTVASAYAPVGSGAAGQRRSAQLLVTGLAAGASVTLTWAGASTGGSATLRVGGTGIASGNGGPATMVVRDAPF
jgi:hypothetical protein